MKKILALVLLFFSLSANGADWIFLSSDELASTFLDASSIKRASAKQVNFQIKQVFRSQRDMMGLQHNAAVINYRISCQLGLVLFQQKFLLNGDEIVWTFPASEKKQNVTLELSDEVLQKVCRSDPSKAR